MATSAQWCSVVHTALAATSVWLILTGCATATRVTDPNCAATTCLTGTTCVQGRCVPNNDVSCIAILCPTGTTCSNGKCLDPDGCNPGYANCNRMLEDGCEDINSDVNNCGGCNVECRQPKSYEFGTCEGGQCVYRDRCITIKCAGGFPNSDTKCSRAQCRTTCRAGFADCNHTLNTDGCEVNVNTNPRHCGMCGRHCPVPRKHGAKATCRKGVCRST